MCSNLREKNSIEGRVMLWKLESCVRINARQMRLAWALCGFQGMASKIHYDHLFLYEVKMLH